MAKMVPLHQTIEVEKVLRDVRIAGLVTKSNFTTEGERQICPIHSEIVDMVEEGQKLRITFFSMEDDIFRTTEGLTFKTRGIKYEAWNEENEGWDRLFEKMNPI